MGKLRYVAAGDTPEPSPHNFHLPALSAFRDERLVPLRDMRPIPTIDELSAASTHAQLKTHGFTALHYPTSLHAAPHTSESFKDPQLLTQRYVPETAEMLKRLTGCRTVVAETLLLRTVTWSESDALATHAGHGDQSQQQPGSDSDPPPSVTQSHSEPPEQSAPVLPQPTKSARAPKDLPDFDAGFPQFIGFDRTATGGGGGGGGVSPAPKIHLDYSPRGARAHIRHYHPELRAAAKEIIAAEDEKNAGAVCDGDLSEVYGGPRWAVYSVWRPLKPVRRDPLGLGDGRTFREGDYVPINIKTPCLGLGDDDGNGGGGGSSSKKRVQTHDAEGYLARWSEGHAWYWISGQRPEEVLVVAFFDSEAERENPKTAGGTLHSSVHLPGTEDEEARESLEMRCLCVW